MAYIGNSPANVGNYQVVDNIASGFNGSATSFALASGGIAITPAKSGQILANINGIMQQPDDSGSNGFLISGSNIVFSSAPVNGDSFWAIYQGQNVDIGIPSADTVGLTQLSATGTASNTTFLRGDNAWVAVDALPSQSSHSGKFLTTNGSAASWGTIATIFPFYKADGSADNITITSGTFPFFRADGTQDNIGVS